MDENSLLQVLFASIRAKVTPLVTKLRMWTSWSFIRTRVINRVREFLVALFDVRPRHKKDYYEMFGWLVSKRLAFAGVVLVGILSAIYLLSAHTAIFKTGQTGDGVRTYSYRSPMLRMSKGEVRITGKSGYLAYEGNVSKGVCSGMGRLYNPEGILVYSGLFENNKYEGTGTLYYGDTGTMQYQGEFSNNLFEGTGKLYYENGNQAYEGSFAKGMKEGTGRIYDRGGNAVYDGEFSADEIVYSALLGKTAEEVGSCYKGRRMLYEDADEFAVILQDIDAVYVGSANANSLDDQITVNQVYVLKDVFQVGANRYRTMDEIAGYFGQAEYEGNSDVTMTEAVCINYGNEMKGYGVPAVEMKESPEFDDYIYVEEYDSDRVVYLYSFHRDGLIYTFVCPDEKEKFCFYSIMSEGGGV